MSEKHTNILKLHDRVPELSVSMAEELMCNKEPIGVASRSGSAENQLGRHLGGSRRRRARCRLS